MVMFQPYIPAIILAAIYIIWLIKRNMAYKAPTPLTRSAASVVSFRLPAAVLLLFYSPAL